MNIRVLSQETGKSLSLAVETFLILDHDLFVH